MSLADYDGLKAAVAAWLRRTDLAAQIPDFIALAEAQMNRRIRARRKVVRATSTIEGEFLDLPDDFGGARYLRLTGVAPVRTLDYVTPEQMAAWKDQRPAAAGTPRTYTIVGAELEFDATTAEALDCLIAYTQAIPALSASNAANWVLADHPDAYLYGALMQSAMYLKDDGRTAAWGELFVAAIDDINAAGLAESHGGAVRMTSGAGAPV